MKTLIALLCIMLTSSCQQTTTSVVSWSGPGQPVGTFTTRSLVYGKLNADSSIFGASHASDQDAGFQNLTQLVASLSSAYITGSVQKAMEITKQINNSNATSLAKSQAALTAQTQAAAAGADLTKFGISNGLFKPAATTFVQP